MQTEPRAIDHVVLPVRDLEDAGRRMHMLGFITSPQAHHPFGTENSCVFLKDGTYLEALAVSDRLTMDKAAMTGNPFVRHDRCYRFRVSEEGLSQLALSTHNAQQDFENFKRQGIEYGSILAFSRLDKNNSMLDFKLAFAKDERSPDGAFFTCERSHRQTYFTNEITEHPNGVNGLSGVVMSEENPTDFQYFLQNVTGCRDFKASSSGLSFDIRDKQLYVFTPAALQKLFFIQAGRQERGLRFEGIILRCASTARVQKLLDTKQVACSHHLGRLIVPPASGQGIPFLFEESKL